ncbi:MAG: hypothetical protein ABGX47_10920 [Martelella sp.]|uniref:hypothetical protein n=1 Tax=Martelella sp. TaxID=1969699 RepID=UPI003242BD2B
MKKRETGISKDAEATASAQWRGQNQSPPIRPDGLQLKENRTFQERFWLAERWAWLGFVIFVLMALFGFTGSGGPFSTASKLSGEAEIRFPAVTRWQTSDRMVITFESPAANHTVTFSAAFGKAFQVESIHPEPVSSSIADEGQMLIFAADDARRGTVAIDLRAQSPGRKSYGLTVDGGEHLLLSTFVLP